MEPDSLSYLAQITNLQIHSADTGLPAFSKIPRRNFNSGGRFCASGKKCKRKIQSYVEFKSLFFPYGWGVLVYFTALLNWSTPCTFNPLQKPKNCDNRGNYDKRTAYWVTPYHFRQNLPVVKTVVWYDELSLGVFSRRALVPGLDPELVSILSVLI